MKIAFHGAARTVTGSKHIIHLHPNKKILLDCGLFQGMGKETLSLNQHFGFDPQEIDMVIISHAHIDHIGLLPKLVKEGYQGPIYCTEATAALADILLRDSAHIQESDVAHINKIKKQQGKSLVTPLYTMEDTLKVFPLFKKLDMNEWYQLDDQVQLQYTEAGHIIGSACVNLKLTENQKTTR